LVSVAVLASAIVPFKVLKGACTSGKGKTIDFFGFLVAKTKDHIIL